VFLFLLSDYLKELSKKFDVCSGTKIITIYVC